MLLPFQGDIKYVFFTYGVALGLVQVALSGRFAYEVAVFIVSSSCRTCPRSFPRYGQACS